MFGALATALLGCDSIPRRRRPAAAATQMPFVGPDVAALQVGQTVRVRMRIECTEVGARGGPIYLKPECYFEGFFFRLVIPPDKIDEFAQAVRGDLQAQLVGHVVDATGVVQRNGIWSEIVLQSPDQLRVATGWAENYLPTRVPTVPPAATRPG